MLIPDEAKFMQQYPDLCKHKMEQAVNFKKNALF
jgi:hypothetical protein